MSEYLKRPNKSGIFDPKEGKKKETKISIFKSKVEKRKKKLPDIQLPEDIFKR